MIDFTIGIALVAILLAFAAAWVRAWRKAGEE